MPDAAHWKKMLPYIEAFARGDKVYCCGQPLTDARFCGESSEYSLTPPDEFVALRVTRSDGWCSIDSSPGVVKNLRLTWSGDRLVDAEVL